VALSHAVKKVQTFLMLICLIMLLIYALKLQYFGLVPCGSVNMFKHDTDLLLEALILWHVEVWGNLH